MEVRAAVVMHQSNSALTLGSKLRLFRAFVFIATTVVALPSFSQRTGGVTVPTAGLATPSSNSPYGSAHDTRRNVAIRITILDSNKQALKQQSLVRVTSQDAGRVYFETTQGTEAIFPNLAPGKYLIEVGAAGYVGTHVEVDIPDLAHDISQNMYLARDPAAVNLSLGDEKGLSGKTRKLAEKGVQALVLGNFIEARKDLEIVNRQYPSSSTINFLLGYTEFQQKEEDRALQYLLESTKLDPQNLQAQNLLGEIYYRRGDYAHTVQAESVVVARSADSVRARKLLAVPISCWNNLRRRANRRNGWSTTEVTRVLRRASSWDRHSSG